MSVNTVEIIVYIIEVDGLRWASQVAQMVKNMLAMQKTWVLILSWKNSLEKEMATHSCNSCLKNSIDRGVWWDIVHGVAKSHS